MNRLLLPTVIASESPSVATWRGRPFRSSWACRRFILQGRVWNPPLHSLCSWWACRTTWVGQPTSLARPVQHLLWVQGTPCRSWW